MREEARRLKEEEDVEILVNYDLIIIFEHNGLFFLCNLDLEPLYKSKTILLSLWNFCDMFLSRFSNILNYFLF